jgi:hypothetical protein
LYIDAVRTENMNANPERSWSERFYLEVTSKNPDVSLSISPQRVGPLFSVIAIYDRSQR